MSLVASCGVAGARVRYTSTTRPSACCNAPQVLSSRSKAGLPSKPFVNNSNIRLKGRIMHFLVVASVAPDSADGAEAEREAQRQKLRDAKATLSTMLRAGHALEEVIKGLGRKGAITEDVLHVLDGRLALASQDGEAEAVQGLTLLRARVKAEIERIKAGPALRLLDQLLRMDSPDPKDPCWVGNAEYAMRLAFGLAAGASAVDIFAVGAQLAKGSGNSTGLDGVERVTEQEFVTAVDQLLQEVDPQGIVPVHLPERTTATFPTSSRQRRNKGASGSYSEAGKGGQDIAMDERTAASWRLISRVRQLRELALSFRRASEDEGRDEMLDVIDPGAEDDLVSVDK
eukprot:jgi/Mesvir1/19917/Mv13188-RA.1